MNNEGYFSQFTPSEETQDPEFEIPAPDYSGSFSSQPDSSFYDEAYEKEQKRLEAQQRRLQREYNRLALTNALISIPWRVVLRAIGAIAVFVFLLTLWHMRFAILEAVLNFLLALVPVMLIAAIFWYMIKAFFK